MLSVISGPAADPSTVEGGGGAGDVMLSSHGKEGLTQEPATTKKQGNNG